MIVITTLGGLLRFHRDTDFNVCLKRTLVWWGCALCCKNCCKGSCCRCVEDVDDDAKEAPCWDCFSRIICCCCKRSPQTENLEGATNSELAVQISIDGNSGTNNTGLQARTSISDNQGNNNSCPKAENSSDSLMFNFGL